jgi:hypothetical protein
MLKVRLVILFFALQYCYFSQAQVLINEVSNRNSGQITDEDGELNDWIELINFSGSVSNLKDYYLSDDPLNPEKWNCPAYKMQPGERLIVFASGKNRMITGESHWESPVLAEDTFNYIVPSVSTSQNWKQPGFVPDGWNFGKAGFGFGDNDDSSVVATTSIAIYIRKTFTLPSGFSFSDLALHVDYDDGFVAYLNGIEIARRNIDGSPTWESGASALREAMMYNPGGKPELIEVDTNLVKSILVEGENVFAIEVHNYNATSSDLSLIPFLSFLIDDSYSLFDLTPSWLLSSVSQRLHSNFKIDSKGERISLLNKLNSALDTVWAKDLSFGWSLGRTIDGGKNWGIFIEPTPSEANTTKAYSLSREPDVIFSIPGGFYPVKQTVSLSTSSPTAVIRYTLDGSEPLSTSTLYTGTPLSISSGKVIRACSFSTGDKLPGHSVANTYFIGTASHSVPVIAVSTNNTNLYGNTGIFDHWDQEWEKPCYVEYFDDKQKKFEQFAGIQIDGGAGGSRSNPQHSFRLEFSNNSFGDGDVDYKLIPDREKRSNYKSIYIRNGSNQWLTFPFKDAMECKMMSYNTYNDYSRCTPVVIYINGSYFGLYEMREKVNDEYFEENYKASLDSSFHLLSLSYYYNLVLRALNGSVDTFTNDYNKFLSLNPASADYLLKADGIIDVNQYTDYIIGQSWIADNDWPFNNIKIVKGDFSSNRWRFILQDLEWSLNPNGWTTSYFDHINFMINYDSNVPYLRFWKELMRNTTYKKVFINRFADLMNSSYLPENTTGIAQAIYDSSYSEMRQEYVMWGGGVSEANSRMVQYATNMTTFKNELKNRTTTVRNNIVSNYSLTGKYSLELGVFPENKGVVQINTISPTTYPWTGVYFAGIPIRLEAKGTGNYVFDYWEPNAIIKDVKNPVIAADVKTTGYKFIAHFKVKTPAQAITISEINYSSTEIFPSTDWIELYNYGEAAVNLSGWFIRDEKADHKWVLLGAYILSPQERLVLAADINKFNSAYPNVQNVMGSFGFGLGTPADSVQLFNSNDVLVAGVKYSNAEPWPTGAFDQGMTLELLDPNSEISAADNWFAGCIGGSPGSMYTKCNELGTSSSTEVFMAELYPNPAIEEINIRIPLSNGNQQITCRIFDVMGREVMNTAFESSSQNTLRISVDELNDGIYVVQLSNGYYQQKLKFIKSRE